MGNTNYIVKKGNEDKVETEINMDSICTAPIQKDQVVGNVVFKVDGQKIGENNIVSMTEVNKINLWELFFKNMKKYFSI